MDCLLKGEFKKLNSDTYTLKYENDYALDKILDKGIKNVAGLAIAVQKHFGAKTGEIKMKGGGFSCTTFNCFTSEGDHILARNFDYKDAPAIVVWTAPSNGYKSVAVTDANVMFYGEKLGEAKNKNRLLIAPYACMDGINEKGLAIGVLEIKTKATHQNTGKKSIITTVMIRAVLDKCATVDEAVELFRKFDMQDSLFCNYHYHIADASGKSIVIEYVNNEMRLIEPEDKIQYVMNFFKSPDGDNKKGFGYTRKTWVEEAFENSGGIMSENDAMKLLEKCRLDYKPRRGYQITSLWSAVYNCQRKTMLLSTGMNYDTQFKFGVKYDLNNNVTV
ncbi:MAG: linear amide C-N hydrolase [Acutalibacteraceae bacterium]